MKICFMNMLTRREVSGSEHGRPIHLVLYAVVTYIQ